jgi:hypothetical protein
MSLRSKKRRRWARECKKAADRFSAMLAGRAEYMKRMIEHHHADSPRHLVEAAITEAQNGLIVYTPEYLARMTRKKGRPWPPE